MALKNRNLIFAKHCTNNHGTFAPGDHARGAFADDLVQTYLDLGILVEQPAPPQPQEAPVAEPQETATAAPQETVATPRRK